MDDLIAVLIAVGFFIVFYLFVRFKERQEKDPGISLFGGEPAEPHQPPTPPTSPTQPASPAAPRPPEEPQ